MRSALLVLLFIALTVLCWGNYGPLMHEGQHGMGGSSLRPFICVGLAYFLIAVLVPLASLLTRGEEGGWTISGAFWSLMAGAVGAVGALGIIMAFKFRGSPVYVMPLVFGCAPVVNTFVTMFMTRTWKDAGPVFFAGVLIVATGAAGVMYFKPSTVNVQIEQTEDSIVITRSNTLLSEGTRRESTDKWTFASEAELAENAEAHRLYVRNKARSTSEIALIVLSIGLTALCWGTYGPVLHKGQMKMAGSRLRPFMCVGLAYFAIAVIVPSLVLTLWNEPGQWFAGDQGLTLHDVAGILWSLGAGAAGALGALGIIMAFNFGGKPIFVMPLVFGGAPVINTFTTIVAAGTWRQISTPFVVSLGLVILGAVTVLVFSPRPKHPPAKIPPQHEPDDAPDDRQPPVVEPAVLGEK